jgi:hypothetical protein
MKPNLGNRSERPAGVEPVRAPNHTRCPTTLADAAATPASAVLALVVLLLSLSISQLLADSDHCPICGLLFGTRVYTVDDQVTGQKVQICSDCAALSTVCFICGVPARTNYTRLPDSRILCERDARTAVLDEADAKRICRATKDSLDRLFSRFLDFPDTNVTVAIVDRVHLQELFKFAGHDYVCPNVWGYLETTNSRGHPQHKLSLLSGLPLASFQATVAHEYTHAWINENLSPKRKHNLDQDANEGFCELVAYLLMDSQNEDAQKRLIKRNAYTRGQIHLFLEAEQTYGLNDMVDWMKYGTTGRLVAGELRGVREIELPPLAPGPATNLAAYGLKSTPVPDTLVLKGISWVQPRPVAMINNRALGVNEQGRVRVGNTNVLIRCLAIRPDAVRIRIVGSGEERELRLRDEAP